MDSLKQELRLLIIDTLKLEDITPAEIEDDAPLFGDDGLGLDSIDALELTVALEKTYGVTIPDEPWRPMCRRRARSNRPEIRGRSAAACAFYACLARQTPW